MELIRHFLKNFSAANFLLISFAISFLSSQVYAGTMGRNQFNVPGKIYAGVFIGSGSSNNVNLKQYGTAFFTEAEGGSLAVNAFGTANGISSKFIGGQVGYQWSEISRNLFNAPWGIVPAVEMEGYYLEKATFTSHDINNDTIRLPEHDFLVTYPVNTSVFLIDAIANFNLDKQPKFHPYVGIGIGAGILSISNADSTQVAPAEVGVNHYNANPNSKDATFAAQVKAGISFDLSDNFSLFGEYRRLYLANSNYVFGSTVYPTHAATSSWLVNFGSQNYNLGALGLRFSI